MHKGWTKLHRKLLGWQWYHKSEMVHILIHLVLSANHEDGEWQGNKIKRGQLITGLQSLNKETGISVQTIRTCLSRLKSTGEITSQSTNKFRIITIIKYRDYQQDNYKSTSKITGNLTNNQQTTNKQLTANKNDKNEKNDKKREATPAQLSKEFFIKSNYFNSLKDELKPPVEELNKFIDYWTEPNKSGTRQRWELQQTFDVRRRLKNWLSKSKQFGKGRQIIS